MVAYIFDATKGETPATLAQKRAVAKALLQGQRSPQNVGEGISALGDGIVARVLSDRADSAEAAGMASANDAFAPIIAALGGGEFPAAPSAPRQQSPAVSTMDPLSTEAATGVIPSEEDARYTMGNSGRRVSANPRDPAIFNDFMGTVKSGVTNPYALAAIAATGQSESGYSAKNAYGQWNDPSERGVNGMSGGVMSWRADRLQRMRDFAQAQGDDPMRPSAKTQGAFFLQEDPALIQRLQAARTVEEAQTLMNNAWRFAGYNRAGGEAARRQAVANQFLPSFMNGNGGTAALDNLASGGVQVASMDPSAGVMEAGAEQGLPADNAGLLALARLKAQQDAPSVAAGVGRVATGAPRAGGAEIGMDDVRRMAANRPTDGVPYSGPGATISQDDLQRNQFTALDRELGIQRTPPIAPVPMDRVAQALIGGQTDALPEMAGNSPAGAMPSIAQLLAAGGNPFMPEGNQKIINMLIEQEMQRRDPAYKLGLEKSQLEVDAMRNPRMSPYEQEQSRLRQAELDAQQRKLMDLSGGNTVFDPVTRQPVFTAPKEASLPAGVQEYEYARQQGFPGTFQDWEASKRGGMSLQTNPDGTVTFQQGNNIKPLTEGQSKDAVYATRAEGALPLIDQFGDALTSLPETVGGQLPLVGNYAKSPEFQKAEQAGKEFLQAILRKDTGAAITTDETQQYGTVYLPRPGDSPELLAQKKASRARALEAIKAGMPPQALLYVEQALAKERGQAPKQPTVIDGYTIEEVP